MVDVEDSTRHSWWWLAVLHADAGACISRLRGFGAKGGHWIGRRAAGLPKVANTRSARGYGISISSLDFKIRKLIDTQIR